MALWSVLQSSGMLWSFGIFWVCLVHFSRFGMLYKEKSGSTVSKSAFVFSSCVDDLNPLKRKLQMEKKSLTKNSWEDFFRPG
jgi:hypothetical protein